MWTIVTSNLQCNFDPKVCKVKQDLECTGSLSKNASVNVVYGSYSVFATKLGSVYRTLGCLMTSYDFDVMLRVRCIEFI